VPSTPSAVVINSKTKVMKLLSQGSTNYRPAPEMASAVEGLIRNTSSPHPASRAHEIGQGTWEVFYAPHIVSLSRTLLGTRFEPIRYTFRGDRIISNVRFRGPLIGSGWLSASGTYRSLDDTHVQISFTDFWVDIGEDALRAEFTERRTKAKGGIFSWRRVLSDTALMDRLVGSMGCAASLQTPPPLHYGTHSHPLPPKNC